MLNKEDLLSWYQQQIYRNKNKAKLHLRFLLDKIWFYWIFLGFLLLLITTSLTIQYVEYAQVVKNERALGSGRSGYARVLRENLIEKINLSLFGIFALLSFIGVMFFIYVLVKENINRFQILKRKKVIIPFNSQNCEILKIIEEVACRMQIPAERLFVWKFFSLQPFPSIEETKDKSVHLLIPPSFCSYARKHPQRAASIIAHEFGHILQSDTGLYLIKETYSLIIRTIFLPLIIFSLLFHIFLFWKLGINVGSLPSMLLTFMPIFVLLVVTLFDFNSIKKDRQRSETMADLAAVLFMGNDSLLEVLKEMKANPKLASSIQQNLSQRMANIQRVATGSEITFP